MLLLCTTDYPFTFEETRKCIVLESRKMAEHTDWQTEATVTGGLHLRKSEVLRSLRHYLQAQSQGHHTIDHLEERGIERGLLGNLP